MIREITYPCKFDGSMQSAMAYFAEGTEARPLLVALHTWSGDYTQPCTNYANFCIANNWNLIYPNFRGPNWLEDGCGSELVVSDLEDAVAFMKAAANSCRRVRRRTLHAPDGGTPPRSLDGGFRVVPDLRHRGMAQGVYQHPAQRVFRTY